MPLSFSLSRKTLAALILLVVLSSRFVLAQVKPLVTGHLDETKLVSIPGGVHPMARAEFEQGVANPSQQAGRLLVLLKRSAEQESALQTYLRDAHTPGAKNFHQWLTPGEFGEKYGIADSDIQQVTAWLGSHGLAVGKVSAGKTAIEFTGTVGQVSEALHTSIHRYNVNGKLHYANATAPQIPASLAPAIAGFTQLDDFRPEPQNKLLGQAAYNTKTHVAQPNWTISGSTPLYFLSPEDFATQYDVKPAYAAGLNGTGQTIGIINDSNIDISLVNAYRKLFGLPANPPQVVIDGTDPGVNGDSIEAYLDVENAGAVAPNATIKLYIGSQFGLLGAGGLNFAIIRAVDDDAASVLSLSFGSCEEAPTSSNQFTNAVWEQAAAQGQTVLVSSGDSGSEGCNGLGVNGLASTPWNVAVGGSDFYFSDYATGGASIANYWNATNDNNLGSLQKPMVEQVWNGTPYGLNSIVYDPVAGQIGNGGAGGGGASSCAVSVSDADGNVTSCVSGYPKPSWQVGNGVPNDNVRDLPDLSLFASNGNNGVTWPICGLPGDCTDTLADGTLVVTGVGGTSASTPAMAGVMALINQKYGQQGQANYILYPLAAQFPTVINPIDLGTNNEPCNIGGTDCVPDTNGDGFGNLGHYSATPGFDLASGLGSIDVTALIDNWNKVTFKPSTTTLTLSPATITHGEAVTASVAVTGTGTPAGSASLVTNSPLTAYQGLTNLELGSSGDATATLKFLPGGTYQVYAQYSGDGINGASKSAPVTMTVSAEASVANMTGVYFDLTSFTNATLQQNGTLPYGSSILFDVQIVGASVSPTPAGNSDGTATGSVTFSDGTTVLATVPLSSAGVAEFAGGQLALGSHSITASYSGDASFKASTSTPLTFTVAKDTTQSFFQADNTGFYTTDGSLGYFAGQTVNFVAIVQALTGGNAKTPSGSVTMQFGNNAPTSSALTPQNLLYFGNVGEAPLTLNNLVVGTYTLTLSYPGDANFQASTSSQIIEVLAPVLLPTTTAVAQSSPASGTAITTGTIVTFHATVTGSGKTAPTGTVSVFLSDTFGYQNVALVPGTGNTSTASISIRGDFLAPGNNPVDVLYSGDTVNGMSTSNVLNIFVDAGDFTMASQSGNLAIPSGNTGTAVIDITPLNGFSGSVALSCAAPAKLTCTLSTPSVSLSNATSTTITIGTAVTMTATAEQRSIWKQAATGSVLACVILFIMPRRRRYGRALFGLLAFIVFTASIGCSGSPTSAKPVPPSTADATPGTYTVIVSGTSPGGTIHNAAIIVVVQ